jgi:hypothetical protein
MRGVEDVWGVEELWGVCIVRCKEKRQRRRSAAATYTSTCKAQGDWIPPSSVAFSILKNGNDFIVPDCDVLSALGHPVPSYSAFENSKKSAK